MTSGTRRVNFSRRANRADDNGHIELLGSVKRTHGPLTLHVRYTLTLRLEVNIKKVKEKKENKM